MREIATPNLRVIATPSSRAMALHRLQLGLRNCLLPSRRCFTAVWNSRESPIEEAKRLSSGDKLHGYTVSSVTEVPDFSLVAVQLGHDQTGAQHVHLARKDSNNAFGVGFRTTPMDSTGISHILEHTTLCGSRKYPVRDPFFKMLSRSLFTFMNAFTANDWTMYPFSSQNSKDFRNLLSIYLDSVFFPRLKELDFFQEGWRLEHESPNDRSSPLVFKGVVFNEMKGVFANSATLFAEEQKQKLFPSHTYSNCSGGIPLDILNLTWKDLKDFHSHQYHPSNARFLTYGDMPLTDHLQYIDSEALGQFSTSPASQEVPLEERWTEPRVHHISCAPDPMAPDPLKQCAVSVSFLLGPITDPYQCLVDSIICQLLVDGPASPFYQALIDANIGADYSPRTGYNDDTKEASFSVGLWGIKEEDVTLVRDIVRSTLETVVQEGFSEQRVKAVLHQIELTIKHQSSKFGLNAIVSLMSPWVHGAEPVSMLQVNKIVQRFKEELQSNPKFLQERVGQCFVDNRHQLTLVMSPEDQYDSRLKAAEEAKLKAMIDSLTEEDRERVYRQGLELEAAQNQVDDLSCLPTVDVSDVDRDIRRTELENELSSGVTIQCSSQPTNGVTYFRALSGIQELPDELRPYLPLFCNVIASMGAGDLNHHQFAEQCDLYTGGSLSLATHITAHHSDPNLLEQAVLFASHCLDRHLYHMLSLWEDVFTKPNMQDRERLETLVAMAASNMAISVPSSGHFFAMTAAASSLTPLAGLAELYSGLSQVKFLKEITEKSDQDTLLKHLSSIAVHVLDTGCMRCSVNATPESMPVVVRAMEGFLDTLPGSGTDTPVFMEESSRQSKAERVYYDLPFPVHYVSRAYPTVPYTHADSAPLRVLARVLSLKYLHREVREKGGAYGAGAKQGDGLFAFFSYRDPNSMETLSQFIECIGWAAAGGFIDVDIEEAKLSVFSQLDSPVSPGLRGSSSFLHGLTDELRQKHRQQLFDTTKDDVVRVAQCYLRDAAVHGSAVIGPGGDKASADWTVHKFSL